jgi:hypothetical protein
MCRSPCRWEAKPTNKQNLIKVKLLIKTAVREEWPAIIRYAPYPSLQQQNVVDMLGQDKKLMVRSNNTPSKLSIFQNL